MKEKEKKYFDLYFNNIDLCDRMLEDVNAFQNGSFNIPLKLSANKLYNFVKNNNISVESFFISAFTYTLSRFVGGNLVQFCVLDKDKDIPILINCKNNKCIDFLVDNFNNLSKLKSFENIDIEYLKEKYFIDTSTWFLFQDNSSTNNIERNSDNKLEFIVINNNNNFSIKVNYAECYLKERIESFVDTFSLIVEGILHCKMLSDINILRKKDLELYNIINDTDHELEYNDIIEAWNDNVKKYPNNPCVRYEDTTYTYLEVEYITNYIVQELKKLEIHPRDTIGFLVHRSALYIFCIIALLKYNCIYIPIEDSIPNSRINSIIQQASVKLMMVSKETYSKYMSITQSYKINLKNLIISEDLIRNGLHNKMHYKSIIPNQDTVYSIVFTSGSTGEPKGVLFTRLGLINLASYYKNKSCANCNDIYGFYVNIGFAGHVVILFPICAGNCVDIVPEEIRLSTDLLLKFYLSHKITITSLTTRICEKVFKYQDCHTLRVIHRGGERGSYFPHFGNVCIYDHFGSTETQAGAFLCQLDKFNSSGFIGMPIYNTRGYIVDEENRRLPIYAVGNLFIAGNQIAAGYLRDDEQTNKLFVENTFEKTESICNRMFLSGDYSYYEKNGNIINVGRKDRMIKIRGNRVDLSEIEMSLKSINGVSDVTVVDIDLDGEIKLVACVVANKKISSSAIRDHIKNNKPNFMIPSFILFVECLPFNINGKIDRKSILEMIKKKQNQVLDNDKTKDYIKNRLMIAFAKSLSMDSSAVNDNSNFKELGGDSMTAISLSVLYKENTDLTIAPIDILNNPLFKDQYKLIVENMDDNEKYNVHIFNKCAGKPKLVFVHPGIGGAESYINLSKNLSSDIEFACIEHYNILHYDEEVLDINSLAKRNIELLKKYQSDGPYYLGGFSFGGVVAFEMAQLLKVQGDKVECLFLLDPSFSNYTLSKEEQEKIFYKCKKLLMDNYENTKILYHLDKLSDQVAEKIINFNIWNYINNGSYKIKRYKDQILYFIAHRPSKLNQMLYGWSNINQVQNEIVKLNIDLFTFIDKTFIESSRFARKIQKSRKLTKSTYIKLKYMHHQLVEPEASKEIARHINSYFDKLK